MRHSVAVEPSSLTLPLSLGEREQPPPGQCLAHTGLANSFAGMAARWRPVLPLPEGEYPFSVAQIFSLPYRRFVIGRTLRAGDIWQVENLRYSAARQSRNQYVPTTDEHGWTRIRESLSSSVLIRVHPWLKKSSRAATISGDTDRLQVCATVAASALNRYKTPGYSQEVPPGQSNAATGFSARQRSRFICERLLQKSVLFRSSDAYVRELSEKPQRRSRGCGHPRSYFATFATAFS